MNLKITKEYVNKYRSIVNSVIFPISWKFLEAYN